jgi:hypothetical protein
MCVEHSMDENTVDLRFVNGNNVLHESPGGQGADL